MPNFRYPWRDPPPEPQRPFDWVAALCLAVIVLAVALWIAFGTPIPARASSSAAPIVPDPTLTPGVVDPAATLAVICVPGYTGRPGVRHVTARTKRQVFAEYHVDRASQHFEIDHLVSLELGGSNDIRNLWPQSYDTTPLNAHVKDALEDRLHALVCAGSLELPVAQRWIATDWRAAYAEFIGPLPQ